MLKLITKLAFAALLELLTLNVHTTKMKMNIWSYQRNISASGKKTFRNFFSRFQEKSKKVNFLQVKPPAGETWFNKQFTWFACSNGKIKKKEGENVWVKNVNPL